MTRRPSVLTPAQILDAARSAVTTAVEERTVALSEAEARSTSGGSFGETGTDPIGTILKPIVAGGIYPEPVVVL